MLEMVIWFDHDMENNFDHVGVKKMSSSDMLYLPKQQHKDELKMITMNMYKIIQRYKLQGLNISEIKKKTGLSRNSISEWRKKTT